MSALPYGYFKPEEAGVQNHIAVIRCGGLNSSDRILWSKEQLAPYTAYRLDGKAIDRMFGGYIFYGIRTTLNERMLHPMFIGFKRPSRRRHWRQWIEDLFTPGYNLQALSELTDFIIPDVWISLPYPHPMKTQFGAVHQRDLNFQKDEDRLEALDWWIEQFMKRWSRERSLYSRLHLRGFLWPKEAVLVKEESFVSQVNTMIHNRYGQKTMWLPNYGSYGVMDWNSKGFDVAAINSNYYGHNSYGVDWITNASHFAKAYHMGMQVNIGRGYAFSDDHVQHYFSLGLDNKLKYMKESLMVYQFHNETVDQMMVNDMERYIQLYTFIKGIYTG
ncbi:DUF4855 domain-containing protein [Marinicrinis lubricantis]|uniref:DUF4855 domain-containing protein n=1 Tax=Marinicrinis lubricantis TaxID=2086470 RepID=A0ABW1IKZ2_9BACL